MDREQLTKDAARAMLMEPGDSRAEAVLDAILPQITTVEELEALPVGSKVLDESGNVWRWGGHWFFGTARDSCTAGWLALRPLTVVWRP